MKLTNKEIDLAKQLKDAGLKWDQQEGDFYLYKNAGPYVAYMHPIDAPNVFLPSLQQCIDELKCYNIELVIHVSSNRVVIPGKGVYTGATCLEAMYKLLFAVISEGTKI